MGKDQTVFKLSQDPDFADGRTDGQSDRRTHGRRVNLKSSPVIHRLGTKKTLHISKADTKIFLGGFQAKMREAGFIPFLG